MAIGKRHWLAPKMESAGVQALKLPIQQVQNLFWHAVKGGE
jgi:hypothetical protein